MTPKPTHEAANITQNSWVIDRSGCEAGATVFWLPPQPASRATSPSKTHAWRRRGVIYRPRITRQIARNTSSRSGHLVVSISISGPPIGSGGHSPAAARSATSAAASRS